MPEFVILVIFSFHKCLTILLIGANVLAIRQIVDFWSTSPLRNKSPNVHVLLGKTQDLGKSPGVYLSHLKCQTTSTEGSEKSTSMVINIDQISSHISRVIS